MGVAQMKARVGGTSSLTLLHSVVATARGNVSPSSKICFGLPSGAVFVIQIVAAKVVLYCKIIYGQIIFTRHSIPPYDALYTINAILYLK